MKPNPMWGNLEIPGELVVRSLPEADYGRKEVNSTRHCSALPSASDWREPFQEPFVTLGCAN